MLIKTFKLKHQCKAQVFLYAGMFCMLTGLILGKYLRGIAIADFLSGMFSGMSVVYNLYGLSLLKKSKAK